MPDLPSIADLWRDGGGGTMDADWKTTDLCDAHGSELAIAAPLLRSFGGRRRSCGSIATLHCFEDSSLVREWLGEPGGGRVLVVAPAAMSFFRAARPRTTN
jgi:regulator of RNase E activity RraA